MAQRPHCRWTVSRDATSLFCSFFLLGCHSPGRRADGRRVSALPLRALRSPLDLAEGRERQKREKGDLDLHRPEFGGGEELDHAPPLTTAVPAGRAVRISLAAARLSAIGAPAGIPSVRDVARRQRRRRLLACRVAARQRFRARSDVLLLCAIYNTYWSFVISATQLPTARQKVGIVDECLMPVSCRV